jgi:hypothetical protein
MKANILFLMHPNLPFAAGARIRMGSPIRRDACRTLWFD